MSVFNSNYKFNLKVKDDVSGPVDSMEKSVGKSLGSVVNVFSSTFNKLTGHVSKTQKLLNSSRDSIEDIQIKSPFGTFSESTASDVLGVIDYHKTLIKDIGKTQAQAKEMSDQMFKSAVNQGELIDTLDAFIEDGAEEKIGDMMNLFTTELGYVPENFKKAFIKSAELANNYMEGKDWIKLGEKMGVDISKGMKKKLESTTMSPKIKASMLSEGAKDFKTRVTPTAEPTSGIGGGVIGEMMSGLGNGMKGIFGIIKTGMKFAMKFLGPMKILMDILGPALDAVMDMIEPILVPFKIILLQLVEAFRPLMNIVANMLFGLLDLLGPAIEWITEGILSLTSGLSGASNALKTVWNFIVDFYEMYVNIHLKIYGFIYNTVMNFFTGMVNGILEVLSYIPFVGDKFEKMKMKRDDVDWKVDFSGAKADISEDEGDDEKENKSDNDGLPKNEVRVNDNFSIDMDTGELKIAPLMPPLPDQRDDDEPVNPLPPVASADTVGGEPQYPIREDVVMPLKIPDEENPLAIAERVEKNSRFDTDRLIKAIAMASPNPEALRTIAADTLGVSRYG